MKKNSSHGTYCGTSGNDWVSHTILGYASYKGNLQVVSCILKFYPELGNKADNVGMRPLDRAVRCLDPEKGLQVAEELIRCGADIKYQYLTWSLFKWSLRKKKFDITRLLYKNDVLETMKVITFCLGRKDSNSFISQLPFELVNIIAANYFRIIIG